MIERLNMYYNFADEYAITYSWRTNIVKVYAQLGESVAIYQLDKWCTDREQDIVIDLIYPRL